MVQFFENVDTMSESENDISEGLTLVWVSC